MDAEISEKVRAMIGEEKVRRYEVTARDIRRFAQAIGEVNPLYLGEDDVETVERTALVAPPLFCQVFSYEDVPVSQLPADGSPVELDVPIPARRAVGGASSYDIFQPVKAGDTITARSTLRDVFTKQGRSGRLFFIVVETQFSNQNDRQVARETATYIKR